MILMALNTRQQRLITRATQRRGWSQLELAKAAEQEVRAVDDSEAESAATRGAGTGAARGPAPTENTPGDDRMKLSSEQIRILRAARAAEGLGISESEREEIRQAQLAVPPEEAAGSMFEQAKATAEALRELGECWIALPEAE